MKLYLVRHGKTDWNENHRLQGWSDIPLNTEGILQAEKLKQEIKKRNLVFDTCYSSPLKRVLKTAKIITDENIKIKQDDLLKERGFGEVEGIILNSWDEFGVDIFDENLNTNIHGIEPILNVQKRAQDFLEKVKLDNDKDDKILIVSSGGLLKRMLYLIYKDRKFVNSNFHIQNCELIEVKI